MNLKITEEKQNKLLSRKEITAEMAHEGPTPGYAAMKKALAKELKADESLIAIHHIYPFFGEPKVKIIANIYETKEKMQELEPKPAETKKKPSAEKSEEKKKEKAVEEKKPEEVQKEENKTEKPIEKKSKESES
jgi:small subunit ribosomal protein S24e